MKINSRYIYRESNGEQGIGNEQEATPEDLLEVPTFLRESLTRAIARIDEGNIGGVYAEFTRLYKYQLNTVRKGIELLVKKETEEAGKLLGRKQARGDQQGILWEILDIKTSYEKYNECRQSIHQTSNIDFPQRIPEYTNSRTGRDSEYDDEHVDEGSKEQYKHWYETGMGINMEKQVQKEINTEKLKANENKVIQTRLEQDIRTNRKQEQAGVNAEINKRLVEIIAKQSRQLADITDEIDLLKEKNGTNTGKR